MALIYVHSILHLKFYVECNNLVRFINPADANYLLFETFFLITISK